MYELLQRSKNLDGFWERVLYIISPNTELSAFIKLICMLWMILIFIMTFEILQ